MEIGRSGDARLNLNQKRRCEMFTESELKATKTFAKRKADEILESKDEFTAKSLKDLQTLFILKDAAEKKLKSYREV